jgi:hypothetical protein
MAANPLSKMMGLEKGNLLRFLCTKKINTTTNLINSNSGLLVKGSSEIATGHKRSK